MTRLLLAAGTAGVLAAAIALPLVGGAGLTVKSSTEALNLEPENLAEPPLKMLTILKDVNGKQIGQFYKEYRIPVGLDKVSKEMKDAIIAIEDYRFYEHGPIDIEGTARALLKNVTGGGVVQGGSSITQQYVKQVLVNSAATKAEAEAAIAPTLSRKLNELRYAMAIEEKYTKDQILEKYLNISYFGAGAHGIEAAAYRFFGVKAAKLSLVQAATLAAAVQKPVSTDPTLGNDAKGRLLDRRNLVLDTMVVRGKITQPQADEAKKAPLGYKNTRIPGGCEESKYPYFCFYVKNEILDNDDFGKTEKERLDFLNAGGITIQSTLDPKMQKASEKAIRNYVSKKDKPVASQAMIVPGTGEIRSMAASREYGLNAKKNQIAFNVVADKAHGGGRGFQQGSTAKVYTLAAALDAGMKLNDGNNTGRVYSVAPYPNRAFETCGGKATGGDAPHPVANSSEGGGGFKTLQTGTWGSVNTFFMKLEEQVGLCETVKMAKSLGIKRADGGKLEEVPTFTLGVNEMDPITVANSYAVFAARGVYCRPKAITSVTDRDGKVIKYGNKCKEVLDEEVADAVNSILSGVFTKGTMSGVGGINRDAAGKTGTTDGYTAAWFAGYTPDLASAVSIGDPRGAFKHDLTGVTIGGQYYQYVYGASISGPIWKQSMMEALKNVDKTSFFPVNSERFGGCSDYCAPKKPKKDKDDDDRGGGPRNPFDDIFGNPGEQEDSPDEGDF
ncbi:transglycosylase domain-containing protein [Nonomuraea soli]|uniref:Membrane peptidoglycan carboxypeptidase n=1 Tax=Nonomuraea soli TaxID=1032476 RepID=A0A7W0HQ35_9ACTN|nr:transglycosylase domain-containing protein [Nonomuraea soli]MBA2891412.1 membrane peptidoglycan carboxypeptidase [Nonomuraea soli]